MKNIISGLLKKILYHIKVFIKYKTFSSVKYIIFENEKIIYIPISKCWNTSVKEFFLGLVDKNQQLPFEYAIHQIAFPKITVGRRLSKKYLDWTYTILVIIREPLERLISCYYSKYIKDKEKISNGKFRRKTKDNKLDLHDYLFWYLRKDPWNVENFLKKIIKIPIFLMDEHFKPMSDYVRVDREDFDKLTFINLDNLNEWLNFIKEKLNLKEIKIRNKTEQKKEKIIRKLPSKLVKKIKNIYKKDYILYSLVKKQLKTTTGTEFLNHRLGRSSSKTSRK